MQHMNKYFVDYTCVGTLSDRTSEDGAACLVVKREPLHTEPVADVNQGSGDCTGYRPVQLVPSVAHSQSCTMLEGLTLDLRYKKSFGLPPICCTAFNVTQRRRAALQNLVSRVELKRTQLTLGILKVAYELHLGGRALASRQQQAVEDFLASLCDRQLEGRSPRRPPNFEDIEDEGNSLDFKCSELSLLLNRRWVDLINGVWQRQCKVYSNSAPPLHQTLGETNMQIHSPRSTSLSRLRLVQPLTTTVVVVIATNP